MNLTDLDRGDALPPVMSDCRVAHDADSLLGAVVLRVAMIQAACPLGDNRHFEVADFVAGNGLVEEWMPGDCPAQGDNPLNYNAWVHPVDSAKMPSSLRKKVARQLERMRDVDVAVLRRAVVLARGSLQEK
jgi:hypothetical protein